MTRRPSAEQARPPPRPASGGEPEDGEVRADHEGFFAHHVDRLADDLGL